MDQTLKKYKKTTGLFRLAPRAYIFHGPTGPLGRATKKKLKIKHTFVK
jgi:hypothetical protein